MCSTTLLRDHAQRARNSSVDALTVLAWNAAADCEINDDLFEDGLIEAGRLAVPRGSGPERVHGGRALLP